MRSISALEFPISPQHVCRRTVRKMSAAVLNKKMQQKQKKLIRLRLSYYSNPNFERIISNVKKSYILTVTYFFFPYSRYLYLKGIRTY